MTILNYFLQKIKTHKYCSYSFLKAFSVGAISVIILISSIHSPPTPLLTYPLLQKDGFMIAYDPRSKIPLWTYEKISSKGLISKIFQKNCCFKKEALIHPLHQSQLTDYFHSGFDRGHMVAVANQKLRGNPIQETYTLANVCPQTPEFNRGYWAKLEKEIRSEMTNYEQIEIITGPLFLPKEENGRKFVCYEVIGENNVAVPTHFFKIVRLSSGEETYEKAYIFPNQCIPNTSPLEFFEVSLESVEHSAGIISSQIFNCQKK
ncbi:MAG: Nuclease [Chlamydiae bacterium]|nr:Nuclease [Chlamydiota bacterium]